MRVAKLSSMEKKRIIVRRAMGADVAMIARVVAEAIGDKSALTEYCGENFLAVLEEVAATLGTQYYYQSALIAEVNGVTAGAIIGYDGEQLAALREGTFSVLQSRIGRVPTIADETEAGEYYLDSIAVLPEFRGQGVARALINTFCEKAFAEGHNRVGLIVDIDNPRAERLYTSLGFERVGTRIFFGHKMWHLQRKR